MTGGPPGLTSGAVIERNTLWNNGAGGGSTINLDGVQNSIVRNNLLYNCHATGIVNYMGEGAAGPVGMQILNNTVDIASDGRWGLVMYSTAGQNVIRDNLFSNQNPSHGALNYLAPADASNTDSRNNIFCGATNVTSDGDSTQVSMASWQASGFEAHSSVLSLPALIVGGGDYHLLPTSAAIGAGVADGVVNDLDGNSRPSASAIDVGAYQFVGTGTTTSANGASTSGTGSTSSASGTGTTATGTSTGTGTTTASASTSGSGSSSATSGGITTSGTATSSTVSTPSGSGSGGCGLGAGGAVGILLAISLGRRKRG